MSSSSSSSPSKSPGVHPHAHRSGKCPIHDVQGGHPHAFCPPQPGDTRAPCPALNTMANHGYLPRDGRRLTKKIIIDALKECYGLSGTLATFLTYGALFLLGQSSRGGQQLCLFDLARHGGVEHDASLYHPDADGDEYAPLHGDPRMLAQFFADSADGCVMSTLDVARVRARRQASYPHTLDFIHAELARGEMGIVLNMFNNPDPALHEQGVPLAHASSHSLVAFANAVKRLLRLGGKLDPATTPLAGVPNDRMRYWFEHEQLPPGWKPYHKTTLRQVIGTVNTMRSAMGHYGRQFAKESPAAQSEPAAIVEKTHVPVQTGVEPGAIAIAVVASDPTPESPVSSEADSPSQDVGVATQDQKGAHVSLTPPIHPVREPSSATESTFTASSVFTVPTPSSSNFPSPAFGGKGFMQVQGSGEIQVVASLETEKAHIDGLPIVSEESLSLLQGTIGA